MKRLSFEIQLKLLIWLSMMKLSPKKKKSINLL